MIKNSRLTALAVLLSSTCLTGIAQAQTASREDTGAATISLDQITVTATRGEKQILDVPGTVSVISRQDLDERMTRDSQDLIRYEPGISVSRQTSGTDPFGNFGGFTIRGVGGNRVQMQVDGSRVIERITDGTRDFVDLPFMKNVEIVRGPGSVLWGADALGGIVAYRTLDPSDLLKDGKSYAARLSTGFDSLDNSFTKTGIAAARITPQLEAILGVSHRSANEPEFRTARADGGRWGCPVPATRFLPCNKTNPLDASVWNTFGKLVFKPTTDHTFKLTGELMHNDQRVNQLWDYNVVSSGIRNGAYIRDQLKSRYRVSLEHDWDINAGFIDSLRWQVQFTPQKRRLTSSRMQTLANGQQRLTYTDNDYSENFLQADIQAKSSFALGPTFHRLTYGFQGDITETKYDQRSNVTNLTTGIGTASIGGSFANATTTRYDFFIQDEIELLGGRWTITPGLRYANYSIDPSLGPNYSIVPGKEPRQLDSHKLIPQIGTVFKLDDHYSVYARYAEGFKMPTAQQLYTSSNSATFQLLPAPDLRPESVWSVEAGVRGRFADGWFSVGAFYSKYKDFIQNFYNIPGTNAYTYRNLSAVEIAGIEASGEWRFAERWSANVSVSYQYGKQRAAPGAVKTAYDGASPLTAVTGLKYRMPEYGLEVEAIGRLGAPVTRVSASNLFKPGGYAVFDSFVNWKPLANVTVRAGVQNIFDRRYFGEVFGYTFTNTPASAAVAATNPLELQVAPGRTFKLAAQVEF